MLSLLLAKQRWIKVELVVCVSASVVDGEAAEFDKHEQLEWDHWHVASVSDNAVHSRLHRACNQWPSVYPHQTCTLHGGGACDAAGAPASTGSGRRLSGSTCRGIRRRWRCIHQGVETCAESSVIESRWRDTLRCRVNPWRRLHARHWCVQSCCWRHEFRSRNKDRVQWRVFSRSTSVEFTQFSAGQCHGNFTDRRCFQASSGKSTFNVGRTYDIPVLPPTDCWSLNFSCSCWRLAPYKFCIIIINVIIIIYPQQNVIPSDDKNRLIRKLF